LAAVLQLAQTEEYRALQTRILANARELTLALGRHGVPVAYGGTDCQMAIVDGRAIGGSREFDARHFAWALQSAGLIANAVGLRGDKREAARGLRLGLTWPAQRGMDETEMEPLAALLARLLAVYQASAGDIGGRRWRAAAREGRALARRWARK
jgi:glycine hydroxymethyltransferase